MKRRWFTLEASGNTKAAALGLAAAVMLIPANLLPVLTTATSGNDRDDTIPLELQVSAALSLKDRRRG